MNVVPTSRRQVEIGACIVIQAKKPVDVESAMRISPGQQEVRNRVGNTSSKRLEERDRSQPEAAAVTSAQWDFEMELGAQVRAFIVSNVALLGSLGLGLYIPDTGPTVVNISGNLTGTVGLAYYFQ